MCIYKKTKKQEKPGYGISPHPVDLLLRPIPEQTGLLLLYICPMFMAASYMRWDIPLPHVVTGLGVGVPAAQQAIPAALALDQHLRYRVP